MQASSQNQLAAYYMGIPVKRLNGLVWGLAAAVAAIAGLLLAPITFVHANMGFIGLKAFPAAVVGGFGSLPGAIVGGLVIGIVESLVGLLPARGLQGHRAPTSWCWSCWWSSRESATVRREGLAQPERLLPRATLRRRSPCASSSRPATRQDIRLAKHGGHVFWYGLLVLALLAAPWLVPEYWLAQLTFVLIYAHRRPRPDAAGRLHRPVLARPCGLPRRRRLHAGGAEQRRACRSRSRWSRAAALSAAVGVVVGLPALRVKGIYLGIATLAFGFIVEEVFARWESVTGGNAGMHVKPPELFGWKLDSATSRSTSSASSSRCCATLAHPQPAALADRPRLRRDPRFRGLGAEHGHPPGALQDAVVRDLGGAGRRRRRAVRAQAEFISPDQFNILQSIDLLLMIVIGGLGSVHGAFLGAIFLITMPQVIALGQGLPAGRDRPGAGAAGRWSTAWC